MTATDAGRRTWETAAAAATSSRSSKRARASSPSAAGSSMDSSPGRDSTSTAKPESRKTWIIRRFSGSTVAVNVSMPSAVASSDRCASSTVAIPRPCQSSATSNATSARCGSCSRMYAAWATIRSGSPATATRPRPRSGSSAAMYEAARWRSAPALKKRSQRDSTDSSSRKARQRGLVLCHHRADADGGAVAQRDVDGGGENGHETTVRPKEAASIRPPPPCYCVVRREDRASRASRASRRAASTSSRGRSVRTSMPSDLAQRLPLLGLEDRDVGACIRDAFGFPRPRGGPPCEHLDGGAAHEPCELGGAERREERLAIGSVAERRIDDHALAGVDQRACPVTERLVGPAVDGRLVGARGRPSRRRQTQELLADEIGRQHARVSPLADRRRERRLAAGGRPGDNHCRPDPHAPPEPLREREQRLGVRPAARSVGAPDLARPHQCDLRPDQRPLRGEEVDERVVAWIAARLAVGRDERDGEPLVATQQVHDEEGEIEADVDLPQGRVELHAVDDLDPALEHDVLGAQVPVAVAHQARARSRQQLVPATGEHRRGECAPRRRSAADRHAARAGSRSSRSASPRTRRRLARGRPAGRRRRERRRSGGPPPRSRPPPPCRRRAGARGWRPRRSAASRPRTRRRLARPRAPAARRRRRG